MSEAVAKFWSLVDRRADDECWLWRAATTKGYGVFHPTWRQTVKAHRYSYVLHGGTLAPGQVVCHRCDNPSCVNPAHLWAASQADNLADMTAKGRRAAGGAVASRGTAKLTTEARDAIRAERGQTSAMALAERYGVSKSAVYRVLSGQSWAGHD